MSVDRSDKVYEYWLNAFEKFDYFITGVTGTLTAYVGQTIKAHVIGINPESLELLALFVLIASVITGFKRIETNVTIFKVMQKRIYSEEVRGNLLSNSQGQPVINKSTGEVLLPNQVIDLANHHQMEGKAANEQLDRLINTSTRYYHWRNRFLFVGFIFLVIARVWPAYIN